MKKLGLIIILLMVIAFLPQCEAAPIEIKYFYSTGCSHCKNTSKVLDQIEGHYGDLVNIERININSPSNQSVWEEYSQRFNINGVPAIVINEDSKLEGDIKINYNAVVEIIDELLLGIEVQGDELYALGIEAMDEGEFETAIGYFNEAIEIYTISENPEKIYLCNQRIEESNKYILARTKFIEAENYYGDSDYASAKPIYEEIIEIYYDVGNVSMATTSEMRLQSCNFHISYIAAANAFETKDWEGAIAHYEAAKGYTSNNDTIKAINNLIDFCESQLSALELFEEAESLFEAGKYVDAKQYYSDASDLFSDTERILYCTEMRGLCDKYILAKDTYDYGLSLYQEGDYEDSMAVFTNAKDLYSELEEDDKVAECEDYIDACQAKLDEIEYQRQQEEEEREHQRFMRMVYVSVAALIIIVFFAGLIIYLRRSVPATDYETQDPSEDQEQE